MNPLHYYTPYFLNLVLFVFLFVYLLNSGCIDSLMHVFSFKSVSIDQSNIPYQFISIAGETIMLKPSTFQHSEIIFYDSL